MKNLIYLLLTFGVLGCQRNVHFNDFEKAMLDVYNEGDTLIFESDKGIRDTSYISKRDIRYAEWNPFAHSGKYKLLIGEIEQTENLVNKGLNFNTLFSLKKADPDTASLLFNYHDVIMMLRLPSFTESSLKKYEVQDDIYRFKILKTRDNKQTEERLYWHAEYGLIKFVTKEGNIWWRTNCNCPKIQD